MLSANLDSLRRVFPEATFTILARDPGWAGRRFGVVAVPSFVFPRDATAAAEREAILAALLDGSEQHAAVDAVANTDAVIVSGGGNLSSSWPDLLYERAALLQLAHRFGKPSVVLGQTIGPHLDDDERRVIVDALLHARFIGVRELPSAILAVGLGMPHRRLWYQFDDALRVNEPVAAARDEATIAVTIDPQLRAAGGSLFASLADQLRGLADTTGARLVLIPHVFGAEDSGVPSDLTEARLLAERIGVSRVSILEAPDVDEARRVAGASLVISTRYHPIVFGLIATAPSIGIYGDDYCRIKLQGALAHAGLERWAVTYDDVASGVLLDRSFALWAARKSIRQDLETRAASWHLEARERWSAIRGALLGESEQASRSNFFGRPVDEVMPALAAAFSAQEDWSKVVLASQDTHHRRTQQHLQAELGPRRTLIRYLAALRARLGRR